MPNFDLHAFDQFVVLSMKSDHATHNAVFHAWLHLVSFQARGYGWDRLSDATELGIVWG